MADFQAAQAAEPQDSPADQPMSLDDLAAQYKAELDAEGAPAAPVAKAAPAEPQIEAEPAAETETQGEIEPEVEEPAPSPQLELSEADRAVFEQLPPEAKAWIEKRQRETQAAYERQTQEVTTTKRNVEAAEQAIVQRLTHYDQILSQFTQRPLAPPDPALRQTDPLAFDDQMANYVQQKHLQETALQEQARVRAERAEHVDRMQKDYWAAEGKRLSELAPDLVGTAPEAVKRRAAVYEYATKSGYSGDQLKQASALDLVTLYKAQRYDAAVAQKAAVKPVAAAAPKVMKPGPAKAATGRSGGLQSAVKNLSENPTREALAAAYRAELAAER